MRKEILHLSLFDSSKTVSTEKKENFYTCNIGSKAKNTVICQWSLMLYYKEIKSSLLNFPEKLSFFLQNMVQFVSHLFQSPFFRKNFNKVTCVRFNPIQIKKHGNIFSLFTQRKKDGKLLFFLKYWIYREQLTCVCCYLKFSIVIRISQDVYDGCFIVV